MLLVLSACQPMRGRTDQSANSTVHWIDPQATDASIDDWLEPHIAIPPVSPQQGRLFVFLPGSFGQPRHQLLILEQAAISGYHAIGLRYPNRWTINNLCEPTDDPACFEQTRSEILTGADRTPLIAITPANSIYNRLTKLLTYLDTTFPNEGWGQFLDSTGEPRWSLISVGGHSQGGGHAALLGKQVALARVCIFSAPADSLLIKRQRVIAPWLSQAGATPSSAYYGLVHEPPVERTYTERGVVPSGQRNCPVNRAGILESIAAMINAGIWPVVRIASMMENTVNVRAILTSRTAVCEPACMFRHLQLLWMATE
jgi:hypothetical protein